MDEEKGFQSEEEKMKEGGEEAKPESISEPSTTSPEPTFNHPQEPSATSPTPPTTPSQTPTSFQELIAPTTPPASGIPGPTGQTPSAEPEYQVPTKPTEIQEPQTSSEQTSPPLEQPTFQEPAIQTGPPQNTFTPPTAPAPKKKSKKWWILGGCAGCGCLILIALLAFFFIGGGLTLFSGLQEPVKVVEEYLQAATFGDFAKAYTYLSQDLQKEVDLSGFTEFVQTHLENYQGIDKINTSSVKINNNQASVEGKVIYKDGSSAPLEAALVKEGNLWKIRIITIKAKEK